MVKLNEWGRISHTTGVKEEQQWSFQSKKPQNVTNYLASITGKIHHQTKQKHEEDYNLFI